MNFSINYSKPSIIGKYIPKLFEENLDVFSVHLSYTYLLPPTRGPNSQTLGDMFLIRRKKKEGILGNWGNEESQISSPQI